jgi:hypothetical protein
LKYLDELVFTRRAPELGFRGTPAEQC